MRVILLKRNLLLILNLLYLLMKFNIKCIVFYRRNIFIFIGKLKSLIEYENLNKEM